MVEEFRANISYYLKVFQKELELASHHNLVQGNYTKSSIHKLVMEIIKLAKNLGASDIHIEPQPQGSRLRLRVDGLLGNYYSFPEGVHGYMISYLKLQGKLDISEKRLPQDGALVLEEEDLDLRLAIIPVVWGEKAVLRLLSKGKALLNLEQVSFSGQDLQRYKSLLGGSGGLVVITGPVNSGKSTLLYATLDYLNKGDKNIITIEDPVEIKMPGINQMQVNSKAQLTYNLGLRAMLRQDPDVIMVGEIRDEQVAQEVLRGALTGHLVLTTLHTKNALGVISRLLNMGVDAGMLALALRGATAQRLVRKICPYCKGQLSTDYYQQRGVYQGLLKDYQGAFYKGQGCKNCNYTGYKGRVPLYEILVANDFLEQEILRRNFSFGKDKREHLIYTPLKMDALAKINLGLTTVEEVWRVLYGVEATC